MTLELDLTDVEAWEGTEFLPVGEHNVEVDDAKEGISSGGYAQLELQLRAIDGDHKGAQTRDWIIVTAGSAGRVKQVLQALGVDASGKVRLEAADLVGKRARIVVRMETGNDGKERSKVKAYQPVNAAAPASGASQPTDNDDLPF